MPVKPEPTHNGAYNEQPGIDTNQMEKDSTAWRVSSADVQGPGNFHELGYYCGPFVGDPYSGESGLGTTRGMITYTKGGRGKHIRTKAS